MQCLRSALAEAGTRHEAIGAADRESLQQAFVVGKEEGLVLDDRPAEIAAKLIEAEGRDGFPIKGTARIECAIAKELVSRTVELICASFLKRG